MFERLRRMIRRIDLRLVLVINNTTIIVFGILFLDLQRTFGQYALCLGLAAVLEFCFQRYKRKDTPGIQFGWNFVWNRAVSASATALGCLLALNIPDVWWYVFPIAFSVLSKALICRPDGTHIYNPSNFGIVLSLIVLPDHKVFFLPDQFAASPIPLLQAFIVGAFVNVLINRHWQIISYLTCSALVSACIYWLTGFNFVLLSGPDYNALSVIYLMFMISDPKTSPNSVRAQIVFGCGIALVTVFLRWYGGIAHQILGLFIVTSLFFIASEVYGRWTKFVEPLLKERRTVLK